MITDLDTLESLAHDLILDDAYEAAVEEGLIRYLSATHQDPGCYDEYVDLELENFRHDPEEDQYSARARATVCRSVVFERDYTFYIYSGRFRVGDYEEV